jgi:hypothetical protein
MYLHHHAINLRMPSSFVMTKQNKFLSMLMLRRTIKTIINLHTIKAGLCEWIYDMNNDPPWTNLVIFCLESEFDKHFVSYLSEDFAVSFIVHDLFGLT